MKHLLLCMYLLFFIKSYGQKTIPNIQLSTLDGKFVKVQNEISEDQITVISFWATWCAPCINELDEINDVYDDWKEETGVEVIAISTDDSRTQKRIKPMVNGKGWEYKILLDTNQSLKRALNISTIPHVIILKGHQIIYQRSGYTLGAEEELYEVVQKNSK